MKVWWFLDNKLIECPMPDLKTGYFELWCFCKSDLRIGTAGQHRNYPD